MKYILPCSHKIQGGKITCTLNAVFSVVAISLKKYGSIYKRKVYSIPCSDDYLGVMFQMNQITSLCFIKNKDLPLSPIK